MICFVTQDPVHLPRPFPIKAGKQSALRSCSGAGHRLLVESCLLKKIQASFFCDAKSEEATTAPKTRPLPIGCGNGKQPHRRCPSWPCLGASWLREAVGYTRLPHLRPWLVTFLTMSEQEVGQSEASSIESWAWPARSQGTEFGLLPGHDHRSL